MEEVRVKILPLLTKHSLKEIAIESKVPYHTLYSFVKQYSNMLSKKNIEKINNYLSKYSKK